RTFQGFKAARQDVDLVYWLDAQGRLQVSTPADVRTLGQDFSRLPFFQRARAASGPVLEDFVTDFTTWNAAARMAEPVRDHAGHLRGVLAMSLRLDQLSEPLQTIMRAQAQQGQHLLISIVDAQGRLIATPDRER